MTLPSDMDALVSLFERWVKAQEAGIEVSKQRLEQTKRRDESLVEALGTMLKTVARESPSAIPFSGLVFSGAESMPMPMPTDVEQFFNVLDSAYYSSNMNPAMWGSESPNAVSPPFLDSRGSIINATHHPVGSVSLINSKAGTRRANHWHKRDAHLCFVVSGKVEYYQRPVISNVNALILEAERHVNPGEITKHAFIAGQSYYTPPCIEHMMFFPEDTVILSLGKLSRTHEIHEEDLVRLEKPLA